MKIEKAGLYIHFPFCLSKCGYCSFYSIKSISLISDYVTALKNEISFYRNKFSSFDTIYFGGGTPSLLTPEQLIEILISIYKYFHIDAGAEITLEANPGDISLKYLMKLRNIGVNRLNIGVQSFNDKVLNFLGRRHSVKEAIASIEDARQTGFDNLGIDLIYGVHGMSFKSWIDNLQQAVFFRPEHISCYQLSLGEKTPLYSKYFLNKWHLPSENTERKLFLSTSDELKHAGYIHYEVSNFAREDKFRSRHNQKYWRHIPYLGLGPSAHSFLNNKRWWNKAAVKTYLQDIAVGKMPVENSEILSSEQLQMESLFLGMRTKDGINIKNYKKRFGVDLLSVKGPIIHALIKEKLVEFSNDFLRPTLKGMAIADSLALI
ncbi:MAG TPA: radical SAM family heme chaperone HemW [Smithella sp.]|nr:radical SAM family heme chaperone HemW [Smithella sp.]MDM7986131.1 radical SAM family heme chaperone HemW [Smithella sp.]HNY48973.1 radical SAM family heme chaperone HemW [Smithella sp.]HOG89057.1 radical SAM family heme chaperone HemW [Smithella sp.]HOU49773.1 radical SAM family heme chaperone HemW [Smithella sp.]